MGSLSNNDGDGNKNGKKAIGLDWQNRMLFVHFLAIIAQLRHETSNITQPLYGVDEHNTKFSFPFSKLRYGPFGFNPRKFANISQIK